MPSPEIIAHRGATEWAPENTLAAFEKAIELGAGCIELDVRLSADRVPVVFHYFYLNLIPGLDGVVFDYSAQRLQEMSAAAGRPIPLLDEVLQAVGGRIGLEIEIKGPEPESAGIVASLLSDYRHLWPAFEVTSYEPALLRELGALCPGLAVDLLFPRPEPWMGSEVVAYTAIHRSRQAGARAVHLHPAQLDECVAARVRAAGIEIHAWDVNDEPALQKIQALGIPRLCTDRLEWALKTREMMTP